jgi:predicted phage terminase large subunit-like protein
LDITTGRALLIGNLLHDDGIMARMRRKIEADPTLGNYREYPAVTDDGKYLWPDRFGPDVLEQERARVGDRYFLREYRLKLIPASGNVIQSVGWYRTMPPTVKVKRVGIGVDLAISERQTADRTAISVIAAGDDGKFYHVDGVADRWGFAAAMEQINAAYQRAKARYPETPVFVAVEDVGYQRAAIQELRTRYGLPVKPVKVTTDKTARLQSIEPYCTSGQLLLRENDDALVGREVLDFGVEAHDDRADALVYALSVLLNAATPDIMFG